MKKKIAILGSTGSIGQNLLEIVNKNKNFFEVTMLSAEKDYITLLRQAKKFKVKNLIIRNTKSFEILTKRTSNSSIKVYNSFADINVIFKKKIDYVMSSITGIEGLEPTIKIIKYTKKIAIANKESIICGWNIILKELKKNKVEFIPVDSEHFSLWFALQNLDIKSVDKIFLTASGGPFHKKPLDKFKNIQLKEALKHPSWIMGKKISVDSSTMINKVYEVIEAKNIFNIPYKNIKILIHPKSYIHAIIKFNNGLIKIIAHDTTMKIPIFNTLFFKTNKKFESKNLDVKILNKLSFDKIQISRYPMIKILNFLPSRCSLFETILVSANDTLVELFLQKKIKFIDINKQLIKFVRLKEFNKYKKITPKKVKDIINLNNYVRLKLLKKVYKFDHV
tara:strand:- start:3051 stop:4229 length:1179 start_codon:yes stop_codon:yes gene_type:complete